MHGQRAGQARPLLAAIAVILLFLAWPSLAQEAPAPACQLVPGWTQAGQARSFGVDTLYDYMDGNSEGYLLYSFRQMKGVTCKSGEDTILIDQFEMAGDDFAWGIFMANRDQRAPIQQIGAAGQVGSRRATFAKGRYYLELQASPEKDHRQSLSAFASALEKQTPGRTTAPESLGWFPRQGLVPDSIRLVPESVLGLRLLKSGWMAQYDVGKAFVVVEASPESAAALMVKWKARIGETQPATLSQVDEAFAANDKYLNALLVFRKGRYVAGFANLAPRADAANEAQALAAQLK